MNHSRTTMMKTACALLTLFLVGATNEPTAANSDPIAVRDTEEIMFPPLHVNAGQASFSARLVGAERFYVAWRLKEADPVRLSVSGDNAFYYRADGGDSELHAVFPSGQRKERKGPDVRPDDVRLDPPEELRVSGGTISGTGNNGKPWMYSLPSTAAIDPSSVQADALNHYYFHDDQSNWYSIDAEGQERYAFIWEGDSGNPECRAALTGDAVCISSGLGVIGIRERNADPLLYIDGVEQFYPKRPVLRNGATYVPFRPIFEALQAEVKWLEETRTVEAQKGSREIVLTIGEKEARVNGRTVRLDHPPVIEEGTTLVPLRFVGEALGAEVVWEGATRSVQIAMP